MKEHIDIVGNVKITDTIRLKYFLSVLKSFAFLKDQCSLFINIEDGDFLVKPVEKYLEKAGFTGFFVGAVKDHYGKTYTDLLKRTKSNYIINLEDDHFCVLDDKEAFFQMIETAEAHNAEIIPATFFNHLQKLYVPAKPFYSDKYCKIYDYNPEMFAAIKFTQKSYIVGNNCIFRRDFAFAHWGRNIETHRPHEFEEVGFDEHYSKRLLMPEFEIMRAVDDDHGADNSCCLKNPDQAKWQTIFNDLTFKGFPIDRMSRHFNKKPSLPGRIKNRIKRSLKDIRNSGNQ